MIWPNGRVVLSVAFALVGLATCVLMSTDHLARLATLARVSQTAVEAGAGGPVPDGAYVHVSGTPKVQQEAVDPATEIRSDAVAMRRTGWLFQWTEYRRIVGKGVTVPDYARQWTSAAVDATRFSRKGYENVGRLDLTTDVFRGDVQLAGLSISTDFWAIKQTGGRPVR
jgi:hypothetical protein